MVICTATPMAGDNGGRTQLNGSVPMLRIEANSSHNHHDAGSIAASFDEENAADLIPTSTPHLRRMELLSIWGFWAIIAILMCASTLLNPGAFPGTRHNLWPPLLGSTVEAAVWATITPLIFRITARYTLDHPRWLLRLAIMILGGAVLSIAVFELMASFRAAEQQWFGVIGAKAVPTTRDYQTSFTLKLWQFFEFAIFLVILTAGIARDYLARYRAYQTRYAQLRLELVNARLKTLQDQLNPHFLFNTLNGISSLVTRDPNKAQDMLAQLSELLRDTLDRKELEVTLEKELVFVNRYIDIMRARFGDKLETEQHIDPQTLNAMVPNLLLQPLVENAIKHGVSKLDAVGRISITAKRQDDTLILRVIDNGDASISSKSTNDSNSTGLGLHNTQERLRQSYGAHQSLVLERRQEGGMLAEIRMPFHTRYHASE